MSSEVILVGLDVGTTTSSAVVAVAQLTQRALCARWEITNIHERYRSEMEFTPLDGDQLDVGALAALLDSWLAAGQVRADDIFGGGALVTGLAAQRANAQAVVQLVRQRLRQALVATAGDPCLESWLAFMGSCALLSRAHPHIPFLNLDIGGGTTNLAQGRAGAVERTGCLFVVVRHVQLEPGGYRIAGLSEYARARFDHLGIQRDVGQSLTGGEVDAVLDFYLRLLETEVGGTRRSDANLATDSIARMHRHVPFQPTAERSQAVVTLSGGVGELVYAHLQGQRWPATTAFGDLGIDLARRLVEGSPWSAQFRKFVPQSAGRADRVRPAATQHRDPRAARYFSLDPSAYRCPTCRFLARCRPGRATRISQSLVDLVRRSPQGGALRVELPSHDASALRTLGERIADMLVARAFPSDRPLVLLVSENLGKVLGNYVTAWAHCG